MRQNKPCIKKKLIIKNCNLVIKVFKNVKVLNLLQISNKKYATNSSKFYKSITKNNIISKYINVQDLFNFSFNYNLPCSCNLTPKGNVEYRKNSQEKIIHSVLKKEYIKLFQSLNKK